jgi:REP element-mobilizing transposase RayT
VSQKHPAAVELSDFQPLDRWQSSELVVRSRQLPHLEVAGATYFVTFRCHSTFQLPPQARGLVMAVIEERDHKAIDLDAAVVLPDHVHAIFRVIEPYSLSQVLQQIKGRSSRQINRILGRQGRVWLVESFDHIVRHGAELEEKLEYIRQNPVKRGLTSCPDHYEWLFIKSITG